ncbi:MAG: glycosyltransferase family 2 protein [bacterium]|nr:glycosyltransferase family 2 protein [bacterium]
MTSIAIIPVFNEAFFLKKTLSSISNCVNEILVVDDGSNDRSPEIAKECGATVITHTQNQGVGATIRSGIEYALKKGIDIVVVLSGSGKTPGHQIPILLKPILENRYDFVQGSRYLRKGEGKNMPLHRAFGTRGYSAIFSILALKMVTDGSSGFRAFKTKIFEDTRINLHQSWLNRYELEPYLYYKVLTLGYRVTEAPVTIEYPNEKGISYTKMKILYDWWSITRPLFYLRLGMKK